MWSEIRVLFLTDVPIKILLTSYFSLQRHNSNAGISLVLDSQIIFCDYVIDLYFLFPVAFTIFGYIFMAEKPSVW